jgi:hypothetical protein
VKELSDNALMDSAWRELRGIATSVRADGRSSTRHSAPFTARYGGICDRCGLPIRQDLRFHRDFAGVVHTGCRSPKVGVRRIDLQTVENARQPSVCPDCHLEHAGQCW